MAEEARDVFCPKPRGTPEEEFQRLIDSGCITLLDNRWVKVNASKLFGVDEEEPGSLP